jgi:hypothetical protein
MTIQKLFLFYTFGFIKRENRLAMGDLSFQYDLLNTSFLTAGIAPIFSGMPADA